MHNELIEWKTNFWRDDRIAGVYDRLMQGDSGITPLKNQIETELLQTYVTGETVLDVGAGTGRGSLPLARAGITVTAIDSSQAMLDRYARDAEGLPLTCQVGDAANLAFADSTFDSLVSLNAMVHFPHWKTVLAEWARVVKPAGRLVFDLYSQDHYDSVNGVLDLSPLTDKQKENCVSYATGEVVSSEFMTYLNRVRTADIVAEANTLGLRVVDIVPYGINLFAVDNNLWRLSTLAEGGGWTRLQSWMGVDAQLDAFVLFIERSIVAKLSSRVTGAYMVVLEKRADTEGNAAWLQRDAALNAALGSQISPQALAGFDLGWDADWRAQLNAHLDWPRNRVLFYFLWSGFWDFPARLQLADFLDARHVEALEQWQRQWQLDQTTTHWLRAFIQAPEFADQFEWRGVNLRAGLEYELTRELLTDYFKAFRA
jgi:ubiquinone/menaquinone biosynthesis C-methylase UbiE